MAGQQGCCFENQYFVSIRMNPSPLSWYPNNADFKNVHGFARNSKISHTVISQWSMIFILLFVQYVILRVALQEVLIVTVLGHMEANVKSFQKTKQNENNF